MCMPVLCYGNACRVGDKGSCVSILILEVVYFFTLCESILKRIFRGQDVNSYLYGVVEGSFHYRRVKIKVY